MHIITELQRRNIIRTVVAYAVFSWVVLQLIDIVGPVFSLDDAAIAVALVGLAILFPFVIGIAWLFKWTPEGFVHHGEDKTDGESTVNFASGGLNVLIVGFLSIALMLVVLDAYVIQDDQPTRDSIAVLPFANLSGDDSKEYFSDGLSEELLNLLARTNGLKVAARTSSFAYRGQNQDIRNIGETLGVATVLEGSVRQSGSRIRVTAQLINVEDGYHLWSNNFDRELTDLFQIQDEIAASIVDALKLHLDTQAETPTGIATNFPAYDAYLQGLKHEQNFELIEALKLYRQSTELDPNFAKGWAGRARIVVQRRETAYWGDIPREEAEVLAKAALEKALSLDSNLPEALVAQGIYLFDRLKYEEALASFQQALDNNPNNVEALTWQANVQSRLGYARNAEQTFQQALDLDPKNDTLIGYVADFTVEHSSPVLAERIKSLMPAGMLTWYVSFYGQFFRPPNEAVYEVIMTEERLFRSRPELALRWTGVLDEELVKSRKGFPAAIYMWELINVGEYELALQIYDSFPEPAKGMVLNLEEMAMLRAAIGDCATSVELLERAHGARAPVYGSVPVDVPRSNLTLALTRASCLRTLGRMDESEIILADARKHVETLRQNADCCYAKVDAMLRLMDGDKQGASNVISESLRTWKSDRTVRNHYLIQDLVGEPEFDAAIAKQHEDVKQFRAKLGIDAVSTTGKIY